MHSSSCIFEKLNVSRIVCIGTRHLETKQAALDVCVNLQTEIWQTKGGGSETVTENTHTFALSPNECE